MDSLHIGEIRKLSDVYGVSRKVPLTYVSRTYVDDVFQESLSTGKHIVVYGGSKQGKTCLRKNCIPEHRCVVVQCSNTAARVKIYETILKEAGATVEVAETRTTAGVFKLGVSFEGEGGVPFVAKAKGKGEGGYERRRDHQRTRRHFEIDPSDANDVIRVLREIGFDRYIVLEDFHYLSEEVQKEIAVDLKAFHEKSDLSFVIIGVWLESNRLVFYNGDLKGRLVAVNADKWEQTDLEAVIIDGESLLNIRISEEARHMIVRECQDNVGLLQEICYKICSDAGVRKTQAELRTVGATYHVSNIIESIAEEHAGLYSSFLRDLIQGFQTTELDMYRWVAYVVVTATERDLKRGLRLNRIHKTIEQAHPKAGGKLHHNNVIQALKGIRRLQHKKKIQPVILDYDSNGNILHVVDVGFFLYLNSQRRDDLLELIGMSHHSN